MRKFTGGEAAALLDEARETLAAFKVPALIRVLDEFLVTSGTNGTKIRTTALREWAAALLAAEDEEDA